MTMTLDHVSETLARNVEFAHAEYCRATLVSRTADAAMQAAKATYEKLAHDASEVQRALASIEADVEADALREAGAQAGAQAGADTVLV